MQMDTNLTNSTRSESTSSLILTSMFVGFNNKYRNSHNQYGVKKKKTVFFSHLRYMNISDEWETPEKQPFKDFVSIYFLHLFSFSV